MRFLSGLMALSFVLAASISALAQSSDDVTRMAPEEVEAVARSLVSASAASQVADDEGLRVSVRATTADRLGAFRTGKDELGVKAIWVVEVQGETGADGAFYVIDDETGGVLAHGVVAAPREHGARVD